MKKLLLASIVVFSAVQMGYSQIELGVFTGYQFGSRTYVSNGQFVIDDGQDYAISLGAEVRPGMIVQFEYTYIPTTAYLDQFVRTDLGELDIHYWQIGAQSPHAVGDNVDIYGLFMLGGTTFSPKDPFYQTTTKFSLSLGGGAKIWISDRVGIKLQGRFLVPVTWGGLTFGTSGTGFTTGSALLSGDLGGGLVFKLGG